MQRHTIPKPLRWLFFALAIGTLLSSGIYLRISIDGGLAISSALRSIMFLLIGVFATLMYGESNR